MGDNSIEDVEVQVDVERLEPEVIINLQSTSGSHDPWSGVGDGGNDDAHKCDRCGKLYKSASYLQVHNALKHPMNQVEVACIRCDKKYSSVLSLQKHMRYKHFFDYNCAVCYRRFATMEQLSLHETTCVKSDTPCEECGKVFRSVVALQNHRKYMHPIAVNENRCYLCRRTFRSARGLTNHMSTVHPPGTHCETCDKTFTSVSAFQSHNLHRHMVHNFACQQCPRVFASANGLQKHQSRKHKTAYMCGLCKKFLTSSESLVDHVMEEHTK